MMPRLERRLSVATSLSSSRCLLFFQPSLHRGLWQWFPTGKRHWASWAALCASSVLLATPALTQVARCVCPSICAVYLLDANFVNDGAKFIAGTMVGLCTVNTHLLTTKCQRLENSKVATERVLWNNEVQARSFALS